jgi:outer membrane immunogenic protein
MRESIRAQIGGHFMKKLLLTGVAFAALIAVGPALAADVAAPAHRAPVVVPVVAAYNWTGFYVGGNFGYSTTREPSSAHLLDPTGAEQIQTFLSLSPSGWVGGGQIGYNWQVLPHIVLGVEGDWDWTNQRDWACGVAGTGCTNANPAPFGASYLSQKYDWISTLRARVGWAQDSWLFYVTGGVAWAKVDTDLALNCPLGCANLAGPTIGAGSFSDSRHGWAAGVGIEVVIWSNLTARLEYLHLDFGNTSQTLAADAPGVPGTPPQLTFLTVNSQLRDDIVRIGLNYKFGYTPVVTPIVTK